MGSKRSSLATGAGIAGVSLAKISKFESGDITAEIKASQMIVTLICATDQIHFATESPITEDERFDANWTSKPNWRIGRFEHRFFIGQGHPLTAERILQ